MPRQDQEAGDSSQQYQASRDANVTNVFVTNTGLTAVDVIDIARAEANRIKSELTSAAESVAKARIESLEAKVVETFAEDEKLRNSFADPDFQYSLRDANRAAASSGEQHTEDLLVDLLKNRAERGNNSRVRLATSQAIRAADKLTVESLNGLTAVWLIGNLGPAVPGLANTVTTLFNVALALRQLELPSGGGWIDDADALNLIRTFGPSLVQRKSYAQRLQDIPGPFLNAGIELAPSEPLLSAVEAVFPQFRTLLAPHVLREGFVVLPGQSAGDLDAAWPGGLERPSELTDLVTQNGYGSRDPAVIAALDEKVLKQEPYAQVAAWWDQVPPFEFTVIGKTIGFVNGRRYTSWTGQQTLDEYFGT